MAKYVKCPRCELNYIDILQQQYCDICQKEMKGLTDDEPIFPDEEEMELCPICGENMMHLGEKMCEECRQKSEYDESEAEVDPNDDEEWRDYLDDDDDEVEDLGISPEIMDDEEEESDEDNTAEDDFEYVTGDDIYRYSDDDDDEDEDDDDEDEDDEPAPRKRRRKDDDF